MKPTGGNCIERLGGGGGWGGGWGGGGGGGGGDVGVCAGTKPTKYPGLEGVFMELEIKQTKRSWPTDL